MNDTESRGSFLIANLFFSIAIVILLARIIFTLSNEGLLEFHFVRWLFSAYWKDVLLLFLLYTLLSWSALEHIVGTNFQNLDSAYAQKNAALLKRERAIITLYIIFSAFLLFISISISYIIK